MAFHPIDVPGLPPEISVRFSTRRRRTVGAHREGETTVITIPAHMSTEDAAHYAISLHNRLITRAARRRPSDAQLLERAEKLRATYLPEATPPSSVGWSTRQQQRWGSCTQIDGTIRLSSRLKDVPHYVLNYVLVHELAHLLIPHHGVLFDDLVNRYPDASRGSAFLDGVDFATNKRWPGESDD